MLDAIIAPDVVSDAWFGNGVCQQNARAAIERSLSDGFRVWQYVAAVSQIAFERQARRTAGIAASAGSTFGHDAPYPCNELFKKCQWLAALAEDADILDGALLLADQLAKAARRLDGAVLVTGNPYLLENCRQAISCQNFLAITSIESKIEFIDLRTQQDPIRAQLECGIHRVLRHGQYILGPEIGELEKRLANFVGVEHCISVASGTDSLLIALMALGVTVGDEVVTVPYTWISTAEVISLLGARPVFVDIEPDTFNMDVTQLERAITSRTKAIMPVSIYGQCPDIDAINEIAARHGIPVIEDAAQSFGATYRGRRSCGLSLVASTSFFPTKPLGCYGDGGALFTNDDRLAELFRQIRVHGQKQKHVHDVIGINGRFDTIQAAVLLAKLDVFEVECEQRRACAERYTSRILHLRESLGISGVEANRLIEPPHIANGNTSVYAQYTITSAYSDAIHDDLQKHRIPTVKYYAVPLHLQSVYRGLGYSAGDFPVAESVAQCGLSLPMSPALRESDQERIVDRIFQALTQQHDAQVMELHS